MNIDWHLDDPDAAFARAAAAGLPLFLYWGARWCPPCNRMRAGVFEQHAFGALASSFVTLQIDGDGPGAQQLAERFQVRSYPTLVVFNPAGAEITRLPCELDGARFLDLLALALTARRTVAESLSAALSRERQLSNDEWRLLSFYSWDTDERQLLKSLDLAATLACMARVCVMPDARLRLQWHTLYAAAMSGKGGIDQRAAIRRLEETLGDAHAVRAHMDIVTHHGQDLVRFLTAPQSPARARLAQAWARAMERLESDPSVDMADQLTALRTRVRMLHLSHTSHMSHFSPASHTSPPSPTPLLGGQDAGLQAQARARVAAALGAGMGPALRHQVINTAAGLLSDAGRPDEAQQLLLAQLETSHAPFYFMHSLAEMAKKRGDPGAAVDWYERAWDSAAGPATRLQWGATYLQALVDFAPHDGARIEQFAARMQAELALMGDAFRQRNRTQMARIDVKLVQWRGTGTHVAALRKAARAALVP